MCTATFLVYLIILVTEGIQCHNVHMVIWCYIVKFFVYTTILGSLNRILKPNKNNNENNDDHDDNTDM